MWGRICLEKGIKWIRFYFFINFFIIFDIKLCFIREQHPAAATGQGHSSPDVEERRGEGGRRGCRGRMREGTRRCDQGGEREHLVRS